MKIGIFGGCFDPIHNGHVLPLRQARRLLGLDRVLFLPTARPPHKPDRRFAPAMARFAMAELALLDESGMEVSAFELTPGRPAYTIDSLEHFQRLHSDAALVLLVGSDALADLSRWHRWRDIIDSFELGVLTRSGADQDEIVGSSPPEVVEALRSRAVHWVSNEPVEISSTALRRMLATGHEPPPGMVPDLVLKYLRKYPNLYV